MERKQRRPRKLRAHKPVKKVQRCWCIVPPKGKELPTSARTRKEATADYAKWNSTTWEELNRAGWKAKRRLIVDARILKETVLLRGVALKLVKHIEAVESGGLAYSVLKEAQAMARAWRLKYGMHTS